MASSANPLGAQDAASHPKAHTESARRMHDARMSVLHPQAEARNDRQIVGVRGVGVIVVVRDAVDVALVVDVQHVEVRADLSPARLPGLVDTNVEGMKERQAGAEL